MIPKIIHYCWFGKNKLPELANKCINTWHKVWPDYKIVRWDESNSPKSDYFINSLKNKKFANTSNLIRFYAVLQGGIYLDVDIEAYRDFGELLNKKLVIGWQDKQYINNAVMASIPNHPFISFCIENFLNIFDSSEGAQFSSPVFMTEMIKKYYNINNNNLTNTEVKDILVVPSEYFYPFPYRGEEKQEYITNNTVCIHKWMKSWG
jgi:mannosyltransferase OCH1-like enzyme